MKVIWDFVGYAHVILDVIEYDVNIVCLFIIIIFHLNPITEVVESTVVEDDDLFFGQIASNDDAIMSTLKNKLQLYQ